MATPKTISIIRECALEIELIEKTTYSGNDATDSQLPWEYRITNPELARLFPNEENQESRLNGWISPLAPLSLPVEQREKGGIPDLATTFAYMYPSPKLAEEIFQLRENRTIRESIKSAISLGGFAYFDKDLKCLCVNAFSRKKEGYSMRFSGVFEVNKSTCIELQKVKNRNQTSVCRAQTLTLDRFREAGFVSIAWVRQEEKFNFKPILTDHRNEHGVFLFFRENGTAAAYAVDRSEYVDPTGYVGILSNVFGFTGFTDESSISHKTIKSIVEVNAWKTKYENLISPIQALASVQIMISPTRLAKLQDNIVKLVRTLDDPKTLFHMACHADLGANFMYFMLENNQETDELSHKDEFGWSPLHYACRFSPRNEKLIKLLVNKCKGAVQMADNYGRYPLHIACDSNTSAKVVTTLIKADTTSEAITSATKKFELLPIHFACYQDNTSESILKALLDADKDGLSVVTPTVYNQLPLHIAIIKKLPASMVKMLLDADSKRQSQSQSPEDYTADIYRAFEGKLPLHWACWNNSSDKIIELLLEKNELDELENKNNWTIYKRFPVDDPSHENQVVRFIEDSGYNNLSFQESTSSSYADDFNPIDRDLVRFPSFGRNVRNGSRPLLTDVERERSESGVSNTSLSGGVALHLAMKHACTDVIGLLLQKETENEDNDRVMIHEKDKSNRTPLHIACEQNVDPQVICALVKLDLRNETVQMYDKKGFSPLHYACSNKNTRAETVNILCNAVPGIASGKITNSTGEKKVKTPLSLAIKAGVTDDVIERLLQPETLCLDGLDEFAMRDLAVYIGNSNAIQNRVLQILSDRLYFSTLFAELYANIGAVLFFYYGSEDLLKGDGSSSKPIGLLICTIFFLVRELLQVASVGVTYIRDYWSWSELLTISFLTLTVKHMLEEVGNPEPVLSITLLWITGFLLILQFICFLRATFHPFARFVGGLMMIVKKMVPFMIILFLMNLAFTYMYWITDNHEDCTSLWECTLYMYVHLFNFSPQGDVTTIYDVIFGFVVIIVLLNVVIAIVSETWKSTENQSIQFLWESRLSRISQLQVAVKFRDYLTEASPKMKKNSLFHFIDNLKDVSYENDVTWTKYPHNMVIEKAHYDEPYEFFVSDIAAKISEAKSLKADLHWAEMDARNNGDTTAKLASLDKIMYIFKWLGSFTVYGLLIIIGTVTGGLLWPKNFRRGVLSVD